MTLSSIIEALVFASPKPLLAKEIVSALAAAGETADVDGPEREHANTREEQVVAELEKLKAAYDAAGHTFVLTEHVSGWSLVSHPSAAPWVRQLYPEAKPTRLSGPALETLAIIAYRQPVTRADIEAVRGVAVDGVMQVLLDRSLVKIAGRADAPGRPLLYSTTEYFLQHFGLKTVDELPNSSELKRVVLPTAAPQEAAKTPSAKGKAAASAPVAEEKTATAAANDEEPSPEPAPAVNPEQPETSPPSEAPPSPPSEPMLDL